MGRIRFIIMAFAVLIIGAILLPETEVLAASLKKLKGKTDITRMDEQGNIVLSISRKKLEGAGYKYGDVVKVYIAGKTIKMPIVSKSADVDEGKPALLVRENDPYIRLSISGGSFAEKYGVATKTVHDDGSFEWAFNDGVTGSLKVSIKLKKAGAYADEYSRRKNEGIDYLALVNKQNPLPEDWEKYLETTFLTNSVGDYVEVELKAYAACKKLIKDVEENDGIHLELDSARRSVAAQQDIWDRFMIKYGEEYTLKTVATPGYSEHQTGLAIDLYFIKDGETYYYNEDMVQHPEVWKKVHAKLAKYGFILRYPKGKEDITGYGYEEWHIRYVDDPAIAEYITEKDITFEEYIEEIRKQEESGLINEGEDTVTKVTYSRYSGKNADMFLSKGDKIAVISPSALPSREQADAVVNGLKQWGYEPVEGKHVCDDVRTEEDILEDLEWALKDPEIKAIFCVRGGYGASEIADKLPLKLIRDSGKLIIGYSDITIYHSAWTSAGIPSVHSCMSGTFLGLSEACMEAEEKLLMGEMPIYTCESSSYCRTGKAKGILIGGNLSTFTGVLESIYDCTKIDEPYILFLEDVNENMQHIHRYLTVLKHLGVLDKAAGIVFGEWTEMPVDLGDYDGLSRGGKFGSVAEMISRQFLDDTDIPVAFGFPAGHGDINYPMLMGEMTELEVGSDEFTLKFGAVD